MSCTFNRYAGGSCKVWHNQSRNNKIFPLFYSCGNCCKTLRCAFKCSRFPTTGAFNPCFTITAVLSGLVFGLFLSKKASILRIIGSVLCSQVFCTLLLNSFWLWHFYYSAEKGYPAVILSRLPQSIITAVLQIVFMALFLEKISKVIKIPKRG